MVVLPLDGKDRQHGLHGRLEATASKRCYAERCHKRRFAIAALLSRCYVECVTDASREQHFESYHVRRDEQPNHHERKTSYLICLA